MKKQILRMAAIFVATFGLLSCSGGSSSNSILFGSLTGEMAKVKKETDKLEEKGKNVKSAEDKAKLMQEKKEMAEKWAPKIEEAAKALDGKPLEIENGDLEVVSPVSLEFNSIGGKNDVTPRFNIKGEVKAAKNFNEQNYAIYSRTVYLAGYDAEGNQVFKNNVGTINGTYEDGKGFIAEGTPVQFRQLSFDFSNIEGYETAKTMKFICD